MKARGKSAAKSGKSSGKRGGNNPQNVEPFQWRPGQSGNPSGRPKRKKVTDALIEALEALAQEGDKTAAEAVARAMVLKAVAGDVKAATFIADRTEGKPLQAIRLDGNLQTDSDARLEELLAKALARADDVPKS